MVAAGRRRPSGPSVRKAVSGVDGSESHKNHMQLLWSSPGNEHLRLWKVHAASDVWKTFRMSVRQANFLLIRGRVDKFWHERVVSRKFRDDPWIRCSFRHLGRPLCTRGMFSSSVHQGSAGKNIINRRNSYHNLLLQLPLAGQSCNVTSWKRWLPVATLACAISGIIQAGQGGCRALSSLLPHLRVLIPTTVSMPSLKWENITFQHARNKHWFSSIA